MQSSHIFSFVATITPDVHHYWLLRISLLQISLLWFSKTFPKCLIGLFISLLQFLCHKQNIEKIAVMKYLAQVFSKCEFWLIFHRTKSCTRQGPFVPTLIYLALQLWCPWLFVLNYCSFPESKKYTYLKKCNSMKVRIKHPTHCLKKAERILKNLTHI